MTEENNLKISFNPILNNDVKDRNKYSSNTLLDSFKDKFSTSLLNIGHIEIGERFQGICYVTDMRLIRNSSDPTKYDGRFELIDGQGRKFRATFWGMSEEFKTHNSLAYVEGVNYTVGNMNNPKRIYKLDQISQSTLDIPRHVFFKSIEGLDAVRDNVKNELAQLIDPEFILVRNLLESEGLIRDLETIPFDNVIYIEMGSRLKIYMATLMDAVNFHKIYNLNFDLLRIGTALALWQREARVTAKSGRVVDLDYNYYAEQLIYKADLTLETRLSLMSFIKNDGNTIESIFVNKCLDKYKDMLKAIDNVQEKVVNLIF